MTKSPDNTIKNVIVSPESARDDVNYVRIEFQNGSNETLYGLTDDDLECLGQAALESIGYTFTETDDDESDEPGSDREITDDQADELEDLGEEE